MRLSDTQKVILIYLLTRGDDIPTNISNSDLTDVHRGTVSRAMSDLHSEGFVRPKGNGVWTLTDAGIQLAQNVYRDDSNP